MTKVLTYGSLLKRGFGNSYLLNVECINDSVYFQGTMASLGGYPCCTQHGDTKIMESFMK